MGLRGGFPVRQFSHANDTQNEKVDDEIHHDDEDEDDDDEEWWVDAEEGDDECDGFDSVDGIRMNADSGLGSSPSSTPHPSHSHAHIPTKGHLAVYDLHTQDEGESLLLLLEWIYFGSLELTLRSSWGVLGMARRCEMPELEGYVETFLEGVLYRGTEATFLSDSDVYIGHGEVGGKVKRELNESDMADRSALMRLDSSDGVDGRKRIFLSVRDEKEWEAAIVGALKAEVKIDMLRKIVDVAVRDHLVLEKRRGQDAHDDVGTDGSVELTREEYRELFGVHCDSTVPSFPPRAVFDEPTMAAPDNSNNSMSLSVRIRDPRLLESMLQSHTTHQEPLSPSFTALTNPALFAISSFTYSSLNPFKTKNQPEPSISAQSPSSPSQQQQQQHQSPSLPFVAFLLLRQIISHRDTLSDPLSPSQIRTLLSLIPFEGFTVPELEYLQTDERLPRDVVLNALIVGVKGREKVSDNIRKTAEKVVEVAARVVVERSQRGFPAAALLGTLGSLAGGSMSQVARSETGSGRGYAYPMMVGSMRGTLNGSFGRRSASAVASFLLQKLGEEVEKEETGENNNNHTNGNGGIRTLRIPKSVVVGSLRGSRRGMFRQAGSLRGKKDVEEASVVALGDEAVVAGGTIRGAKVAGKPVDKSKPPPRRVRLPLVMDLFEKTFESSQQPTTDSSLEEQHFKMELRDYIEDKDDDGEEEFHDIQDTTFVQSHRTTLLKQQLQELQNEEGCFSANVTRVMSSPPKMDLPGPAVTATQEAMGMKKDVPPAPPVRQNTRFVRVIEKPTAHQNPDTPSTSASLKNSQASNTQATAPIAIPQPAVLPAATRKPSSPITDSETEEDEDDDIYAGRDSLPGRNLPRLEDLPPRINQTVNTALDTSSSSVVSNSFLDEMMDADSDFDADGDSSDDSSPLTSVAKRRPTKTAVVSFNVTEDVEKDQVGKEEAEDIRPVVPRKSFEEMSIMTVTPYGSVRSISSVVVLENSNRPKSLSLLSKAYKEQNSISGTGAGGSVRMVQTNLKPQVSSVRVNSAGTARLMAVDETTRKSIEEDVYDFTKHPPIARDVASKAATLAVKDDGYSSGRSRSSTGRSGSSDQVILNIILLANNS
jgi:hypothetical protein